MSTGGSLGLGLPGARRLMDDFTIRSGPGGTVVAMARWEGGLLADGGPGGLDGAARAGRRGGRPAVPQRAAARRGRRRPRGRGGELAGARGRGTRRRSWPTGRRAELDPGERLGLAVASVSALDGRLAWLRAGAVGCVLLRGDSDVVLFPPTAVAISRYDGGAAAGGDGRRPPRRRARDGRHAAGSARAGRAGAAWRRTGRAGIRLRAVRARSPRAPAARSGGVERRSTLE